MWPVCLAQMCQHLIYNPEIAGSILGRVALNVGQTLSLMVSFLTPLIKKLYWISSRSLAEKICNYWLVIQENRLGGPHGEVLKSVLNPRQSKKHDNVKLPNLQQLLEGLFFKLI